MMSTLKNKLKTSVVLLGLMLIGWSVKLQAMPVIDPGNLVQNITQAIQSKLSGKLTGDVKTIAKGQLKADNQTVAEEIGINSTVKTDLNLDMAEFNYTNSISNRIKDYYTKDINIDARDKAVYNRLNQVRGYYNSNLATIVSVGENEYYIRKIKVLGTAYTLVKSNTAGFINPSNTAATEIKSDLLNTLFENVSNSSESGSIADVNTAQTEAEFNSANRDLAKEQKALSDLETTLNNMESADMPDYVKMDMKYQATRRYLMSKNDGAAIAQLDREFMNNVANNNNMDFGNVISGLSDNIMSKMDNLSADYQSKISGLFSGAVGDIGGGIFGGSETEKGKGQTIKIDAKNGRLEDADRIKLINKTAEAYANLDNKIILLYEEMLELKAKKTGIEYVKGNKLDLNNFYKKGKAFDYEINSNFDNN